MFHRWGGGVHVAVASQLQWRTSMPIHPELLAILACPACRTPVALTADGGGPPLRPTAAAIYPIKDDIPVMLVDEATIDGEPTDRTAGDTTPS